MEITDTLFQQLIALKQRLEEDSIPLILGGGMGLWLRDSFLQGPRSPLYPKKPQSRSTDDLDLLLTAQVIVNPSTMTQLRDVLAEFGYSAVVNYMQFSRELTVNGQPRTVKVDLLAAPPRENDLDKVKINAPRIRPKDASKIHAYLTPEAAGIHIAPVTLDTSPALDDDERGEIQIPSSLNYLILKLHAFKDRHKITDKNPDGGRHHAFDIFRIATDMRESDWTSAQVHIAAEKEKDYLRVAAFLQRRHFRDNSALGVIRLRDNLSYKSDRSEFDSYLPDFLKDLEELFTDVTDPSPEVLKAWKATG